MEFDNIAIDSATDGMEMLKPFSNMNKQIEGNQVVQNPNTVANRTRQDFISCARTAPEQAILPALAVSIRKMGTFGFQRNSNCEEKATVNEITHIINQSKMIDTVAFFLLKKMEYLCGFTTQKYRFTAVSVRVQTDAKIQRS